MDRSNLLFIQHLQIFQRVLLPVLVNMGSTFDNDLYHSIYSDSIYVHTFASSLLTYISPYRHTDDNINSVISKNARSADLTSVISSSC